MPTYAYLCPNCKDRFDVIKSVKEYNREERCECGAISQKNISVPTIMYKCGGFTKRPERDVDSEIKQIIDREVPQREYNPFNEMVK